jgi:hypothetical protein
MGIQRWILEIFRSSLEMKRDDETRAKKLGGILDRLKQGKNVQNRDLQTWLSAEAFEQIETEWTSQKTLRADLEKKPAAIVEYERRLKRATFTYHRADSFSLRGKAATAKRMFDAADALFERLLEHLREIVEADPGLIIWFDREIDFDKFGLTPGSVPLCVTSKSLLNGGRGSGVMIGKQRKLEVKIAAVEEDLARLERSKGAENDIAARLARSRNMIARLRDGD